MEQKKVISCIGCAYYYITWQPRTPKGCKFFGFKSALMPCQVVRKSTGLYCTEYTPKE